MENYTYSETTPGEEFRNKETNELKPPTRLISTASNWTKMKCDSKGLCLGPWIPMTDNIQKFVTNRALKLDDSTL